MSLFCDGQYLAGSVLLIFRLWKWRLDFCFWIKCCNNNNNNTELQFITCEVWSDSLLPDEKALIWTTGYYYITSFSCLLQHVEVPVPSAKKDEVLLKLEATSLNPYDFKIQKGVARPFLPRSFPYIPGNSSLLGVDIFCVYRIYCTNYFTLSSF